MNEGKAMQEKLAQEAAQKAAAILTNQQYVIDFVRRASASEMTDALLREFNKIFGALSELKFTDKEARAVENNSKPISLLKEAFGGVAISESRIPQEFSDKDALELFKQKGVYKIPEDAGRDKLITNVKSYTETHNLNQYPKQSEEIRKAVENAESCIIAPSVKKSSLTSMARLSRDFSADSLNSPGDLSEEESSLAAVADTAADETNALVKVCTSISEALTEFWNSAIKVGTAILDAFEKGTESFVKSKFSCGK